MPMAVFGAVGYLVVGILYAILAVLLLTTWRGQRIGIYLIVASLISAGWGLGLAYQTAYASPSVTALTMLEISRISAWVIFLVRLLAEIGIRGLLRTLSLSGVAIVVAIVLWQGSKPMLGGVQSSIITTALIPGGLAISLIGLVLVEQLYRNAPVETRWSLKPLVLGVGGVLAFDLFLFSQGVLLNAIDATTWMARGAVNILFVPLIAIAARRNTSWQLRIFVSRQVVFYTTTLVAAGVYLLLMSFGGYLIARYGGSWGAVAQIIFLSGAGIVLITLLFSNTLRARLKVFLNKHFFHNKYDYREEWMRLVAAVGNAGISASNDVSIRAIAQIVDSPAGVLWLQDDASRQYRLSARYETEAKYPDLGHDDSIVTFLSRTNWLIDLEEFDREPDNYDEFVVPGWLETQSAAWLIIPLQSESDLMGFVLLDKAPGPPRLNYEDRDLLKMAANHIAVHIAQARSDKMLAEAQQFEAYNRLTAFLMHDLNNLIAQQSLIVSNAEKHKRNPEFVDDAIKTISGSVDRMKRVMRTLRTPGSERAKKLTELRFILSAAVDRCSASEPVPTLSANGVDAEIAIDAEEFTMVLSHVIRNAQDACKNDGVVDVTMVREGGVATITVSDDGDGMSEEFVRERLFRPFDSTKGAKGMGIGAYQAREFARKHGGDLLVESETGRGTTFRMTIPVR